MFFGAGRFRKIEKKTKREKMIYFITFFVTGYWAYKAKKGKKVYSVLIILWISLLAGLRDETIGTDIMVYGNRTFEAANGLSFRAYIQSISVSMGIEPLYGLLNYIVAFFTPNVHVLYFFIEFIIINLVYSRLMQLETPRSVVLGLLIFECLFMGASYNLLRQGIAMSIIFFASQYLERKKYLKYILCTLIATGFHSSAIMGLLFLVMYIVIRKKNTIYTHILIIFASCVATLLYSSIINFLIYAGILSQKYLTYLDEANMGIDVIVILIRLPVLILILLFYKSYCKKNTTDGITNYFLVDIMILEIILAELKVISVPIYRISMYLSYFKMLAYPKLEQALENKKNKQIVIYFITFYCLLMFLVLVVIRGNDQVYPYKTFLFQ